MIPGRSAAAVSGAKPRRGEHAGPVALREHVRTPMRVRSAAAPSALLGRARRSACRVRCRAASGYVSGGAGPIRSTSAPCSASVRAQVGPASTCVTSSTRTPPSGRSPRPAGSGSLSPILVTSSSGSPATAAACSAPTRRGCEPARRTRRPRRPPLQGQRPSSGAPPRRPPRRTRRSRARAPAGRRGGRPGGAGRSGAVLGREDNCGPPAGVREARRRRPGTSSCASRPPRRRRQR